MHIVIMGCGRVGAELARELEGRGHSIAVIDRDPTAFRRLGSRFGGRRVTGLGFDRQTLEKAGLAEAGAFAAVSSGDNSNIIAARVAREVFGVENVTARIYDPRRAEVYERLGIPTVATVRWTADQMLRRLLPSGAEPLWQDPSGAVQLSEVHISPGWLGHKVAFFQERTGVRVAFLTRMGEAMLPTSRTVLQEGDLVHVMLPSDRVAEVEAACALGPEEERA
ncbi:TrkA family potassium uptake protein [Streptomyces calidiresistens]|uniref:Trk system potassium uptake protein TrkA n=1 Tax=Streptomyces calidiresistens TaxID=1485586 RepID=A0A7W3T2W0_9ACTN|nr:TrkA family potassium uptake protein [Streptomyces calidiresistens]MBB0229586.1 TrkA family potassium uptake protein [Streptomyces calidiresistens]